MLPTNVHHNKGFTLAETAVTVAVIGILAAIAAPSFTGWLNKKKVEDALVAVRGALQETQREAIRRSNSSCTVNIPSGSNQTITGTCLLSNRELKNVDIRRTSNISSITFNFRGGTSVSNLGTIVLSAANTSTQKCLVIASEIGLMRSGDYSGTGTTSTGCTTSQ